MPREGKVGVRLENIPKRKFWRGREGESKIRRKRGWFVFQTARGIKLRGINREKIGEDGRWVTSN